MNAETKQSIGNVLAWICFFLGGFSLLAAAFYFAAILYNPFGLMPEPQVVFKASVIPGSSAVVSLCLAQVSRRQAKKMNYLQRGPTAGTVLSLAALSIVLLLNVGARV